MTRLINVCWFVFKWGLVLVIVCGVGAYLWLRDSIDDEIRGHVVDTLAAHYPELDISVESAERIEGQGILIRGLSLAERDASGPFAELAHFEEILLSCRADLQDLLSGQLDVHRIAVRRPTLRVTRRQDGAWSTEKLLPLPKFGEASVLVTVESGSVVLFDPVKNPSSTLTVRDINFEFRPRDTVPPVTKSKILQFVGSLSGDHFGHVELEGWYDAKARQWSVGGRADQVSLSPELRRSLPEQFSAHLKPLDPLRGTLVLNFRAFGRPDREVPVQFDVRARVRHGRVDDPRLPYPLTDVNGTARFDHEGFVVENITARSGRTAFWLSASQKGYGSGRPLSMLVRCERLVLDRQLVDALPPQWQRVWYQYSPAGEINAQLKLAYDGTHWKPELLVDGVDVSFTFYRFPYRLDRGHGSLTLKDDVLRLQMEAYAGSRPVKITADVTQPGPRSIGFVSAQTTDLPLDGRLLAALKPNMRKIVQSFSPSGSIDMTIRVRRDRPDTTWQHHSIIDLKRIAIRHVKFPYPLRDVRGRLEGINRQWTFRDLVGTNDTGYITCQGHSVPTPSGSEVVLEFRGQGVPLDEEFRKALPESMQSMWTRWKPQGRVNLVSQMRYLSERADLEVDVDADLGEQGIAIEPDFFPYRMENVRGQIQFRRGLIDFARLTARHGTTQMAASGRCQYTPDGTWDFRLASLAVDRLKLDRDFLLALPARLRHGLAALNFAGAVNMRGNLHWSRGGPNAPIQSDWDLKLDTLGGRIRSGIQLDQINGGARLVGSHDGQRPRSRGWLDLDSVFYKGFQITQLQGPIWLGDDGMLFGAYAEPGSPGRPPRRMTARAYGGELVGDARIAFGDTTHFQLNAQLADGQLDRVMSEAIKGRTALQGKVAANVQLQGSSSGMHTLSGAGAVRVRDGDVYELPLLLSLLSILSIKSPDSTAFDSSDIDFRIDGNHILFDQISFHGNAITLRGKGEMDFDRNIRMIFHAVVGRDRWRLPIVHPVMGAASKQLMLLYVYGTLDNPKTSREALPGVRRAVEGIQDELEEPSAAGTMLKQTKDWFDAIMPGGS